MTAERRLTGVYTHHPEQMLEHAMVLALEVACGIVALPRGTEALRTIVHDEALCARAATKVLNHMLRGLVDSDTPKRGDFMRLVRDVGDLANES